jgi:CRP/FNR family cyclic AMP-dependent transcriptional regulator
MSTVFSSQPYQFDAATLLGQIDQASLAALIGKAVVTKVPKQKVILEEDSDNQNIYFVLNGRVRASYVSEDGKEISLADIGPGDCFGEFSVIDGTRTAASVTATEDSRIASLSRAGFEELLSENRPFVQALLRHLVSKIRQRTKRIIEFSALPVSLRVRAELLRLAKPDPADQDRGIIAKPPTQSELATFISSHREAVAREMATLMRTGLVARTDHGLVINSLSDLRSSIIGTTEIM